MKEGNVGKSFVAELSRLYNAFVSGSALESIVLMAAIVLPILVLQLLYCKSRAKEQIACLERRLKLWRAGDLVSKKEGPFNFLSLSICSMISMLLDLLPTSMFKGETHAALDLLVNNGKGGVLRLDNLTNPSDTMQFTLHEGSSSE